MNQPEPGQTKMILLELNEFNRDLLIEASQVLSLKNIQKVLAMKETRTHTDDTYDSNWLEPWVQWVSVHTGTPSTQHQIKHLGDVPHLNNPQLWEELSKKGVTTGVWGAMNASRNNAKNCLFFLPDPWTFSEPGYPAELNRLLELPRYVTKNYLNLSKLRIIAKFLKLLSVVCGSRVVFTFLAELPAFLKNMIKFKGEHFVFISFTDYVLSDLFLVYFKKYNPQVSIVFLNSIAHLQHHHWHGTDYKNNPRLSLGLQYIDRILGKILKANEGNAFLLFNGLSQTNTNSDRPWILYRQIDQRKFLKQVGVDCLKVEPHMTHDAHLFFETEKECQSAYILLSGAQVNGQKLFLLEKYEADPKKLFYRIDFTDEVDDTATLAIGDRKFRFFDLFEAIVQRTGKHIPTGVIYSDKAEGIPDGLYNHEIARYVIESFSSR